MDAKGMCSLPAVGKRMPDVWDFVLGQGIVLAAFASCPAFLDSSPALPSPVFLFQVPAIEENVVDDKHLLKPWDAKKVGMGCRVGVLLYLSALLLP